MNRFAVEVRLLLVVLFVVRREELGRDLLAGIECGVEGFAGVVGVACAGGQRLGIQPFIQQEIEIAAGDDLGLHGQCPQGPDERSDSARERVQRMTTRLRAQRLFLRPRHW